MEGLATVLPREVHLGLTIQCTASDALDPEDHLQPAHTNHHTVCSSMEDLKAAFPEYFDTIVSISSEYPITIYPNIAQVLHDYRWVPIELQEEYQGWVPKDGQPYYYHP